MKNTKILLIAGMLIVSILFITGCCGTTESTYSSAPASSSNPVKTAAPATDTFTISGVTAVKDDSNPYITTLTITGTIKNNLNVKKSFIPVKAEFYDKDNVKLGFAADYIDDLEPGQSAKFKIVEMDKDIIAQQVRYTVTAETF